MNEEQVEPIPGVDDLLWPTLLAFRTLGGSATNDEVDDEVIRALGFTEAQQEIPVSDRNPRPRVAHRMGWARFNLKKAGYLENPRPALSVLTPEGRSVATEAEVRAAVKAWRSDYNKRAREDRKRAAEDVNELGNEQGGLPDPDNVGIDDGDDAWVDAVLERLSTVSPAGFERLTKHLLRLAGFRDVEAQGGSGDGGIDGVGILKVSLISFPVYFQCKRYKGVVGPAVVRDFRGAMSGRGDKGLLITTGTFTRDARTEATRDGAPPVELISGPDLAELLKEHGMGVKTETRTVVTVDTDYFNQYD